MKIAVKWIYQQVRLPHGGKIEAGQKPSLCLLGRVHMLCVAAGYPVRVLKRPAADFDKMRDVMNGAGAASVADAIETLRGIARRCGITKAARLLLDRASAEQAHLDDEESFDDEESTFTEPTGAPTAATGDEAMRTEETGATEVTGAAGLNGATAPKAARGKKTAGRKAKTKSAAPAKARAKKAPSPKAAKDGTPREGTIGRQIYDLIVKGKDNAAIASAVKRETGYVSWWRRALTLKGVIKAAK